MILRPSRPLAGRLEGHDHVDQRIRALLRYKIRETVCQAVTVFVECRYALGRFDGCFPGQNVFLAARTVRPGRLTHRPGLVLIESRSRRNLL